MIGLPDHGDLSNWVMCQPSGTVLYSCQQMGSVLGKNVVIMGQGAIGLSFTMLTAKQGALKVIAVDPLDNRLELAGELGATHTINPDRENVLEAVAELTRGEGADVTVEAAGYPDTLDLAFRLVRQHGRVVIFGMQSDDILPVDTRPWMQLQPTIIPTTGGPHGGPHAAHPEHSRAHGPGLDRPLQDDNPPDGLQRRGHQPGPTRCTRSTRTASSRSSCPYRAGAPLRGGPASPVTPGRRSG